MRAPIASYGALAVLTLIWGSTWAAIRISLEGIPPYTGVGIRFALAGLLLLLIGRALRIPLGRGATIVRLWTVETLFGFVISYGVVYWVQQTLPSGLTSVLFSTFPIFVALIAHLALENERLGVSAGLGLVVGVTGVAVIYSEDLSALAGPGATIAAVVLLASPIAAALSHVAVKKWGAGIHPIQLATVPMLATGLIMTSLGLLFERDRELLLTFRSVGALLYLVLFGSVVTFTLYYWVLARLPATRVSLMTYVLPIVALTIGIWLFDEPWSPRTFSGTGLVILGVALASYRPSRSSKTLDDPGQSGDN